MADSPVARNYNAAVDFVDRHVAEMHADRIAIRCENRAYSYGEIAGLMNRTGNALRDLGVEVESVLFQHAAVLEAAVVDEKDQDGMINPKAYVVLRHGYAGDEAMERELKTFVKDKIAPYEHPRWISFVSELPKTATGKTQRFKLRNAASAIGASEH